VPYKLAKSLCVMVFRNIEFELWLEEKRGLLTSISFDLCHNLLHTTLYLAVAYEL
jgi:hypothetical protein